MTKKSEAYKRVNAALDEVYLVLAKHKCVRIDVVQLAANLFAGLIESSKSDEEAVELSGLFSRIVAKRFEVEHLAGNAANTRTQ